MKNKKNAKVREAVKDNNLLIGIIIIVVLALFIGLLYLVFDKKEESNAVTDVKQLGYYDYDHKLIDDSSYVFTSYEEYYEIVKSDILNKKDFEEKNFVLYELMYDECSESNVKIDSYKLDGTELNIKVSYTSKCGLCAPEYLYFLIPVEKTVTNVEINEEFVARNNPNCDSSVAYKPMIYLYPEEDTEVIVKLGNSRYLTTTYPKYNSYWKVLAKPNGDLYDENGRYYYGLYWEGNNHYVGVEKDGFVIRGEDTRIFLEEKLAILGLTQREANEFIVYWLPKLYIRFETIEEINSYMPLSINPIPDTVIRVLMNYKALDKKIDVIEQKLIPQERKGFTVVEWGGSVIEK